MELAHAGDDRLTGLFVVLDLEGRILFGKLLDRDAELLLVALRLRLDRHRDNRRREGHRLEDDRLGRVGQRVTSRGLLQTGDGDDVTGASTWQLLTLVGVHLVDLADSLFAVLGGVQDLRAVLQHTRVDPDEREVAVLVVRYLERQRRQRLGLVCLALDLGLTVHQRAGHVIDIERGRQEVHNGVQHRLNALVLERRAGQNRVELVGNRGAPDGSLERLHGELFALEIRLGDRVVDVGQRLEHRLAPFICQLD